MQQCGFCLKVYDESEYSQCPYCSGFLSFDEEMGDDFEDDDDEVLEMDERTLEFNRIINCPGVFDEEGEYIRCPICGHGLHNDNGTITCPECGPV